MGTRARRPALRRRAGHASYCRPPAPARARAGDPLTIFSRFPAFMFTARRFQTGPGRATQRAYSTSTFCLTSHPHWALACRLILYARHARARRLFGCWASVRQSTRSNSYFARVTISKTKNLFFFFSCGTLTPLFFKKICPHPPLPPISFFIYISSPSLLRSHKSFFFLLFWLHDILKLTPANTKSVIFLLSSPPNTLFRSLWVIRSDIFIPHCCRRATIYFCPIYLQ